MFVITPFMSKTKITENNYLAFFFFCKYEGQSVYTLKGASNCTLPFFPL